MRTSRQVLEKSLKISTKKCFEEPVSYFAVASDISRRIWGQRTAAGSRESGRAFHSHCRKKNKEKYISKYATTYTQVK
jgi:hypothetical protein